MWTVIPGLNVKPALIIPLLRVVCRSFCERAPIAWTRRLSRR